MRTLVFMAFTLFPSMLVCADWPQWMGPSRDGKLTGDGWIQEIPDAGLKTIWRAKVGGGYAGPAVSDGQVFVTDYVRTGGDPFNDPGQRSTLQGKERVQCFDAATGKQIWQHQYDCPYSISYPAGPRCTPTVDGDRVYTLGAEGDLLCLQVADGSVVWQISFKQDFQAPVPIWGHAAHPLIDGPRLVCMIGGDQQSVVALDKMTGEVMWKRPSVGDIGYCPPKIVTAGAAKQLIVWHPKAIESLNPETGSPYWNVPLVPQYGMSITMPQVDGDRMYASSIGAQSVMIRLASDRPAADELWRGEPKTSVYCANSTPVFIDGVLYGTDCQVGHLAAVDASDGERLWTSWEPTSGGTRRASHGTAFITQHNDKLFMLGETGDFVIAAVDKSKYSEVGRFKVLKPTGECFGRDVVWSHPAYANHKLFARNDEEIVCVSLDQSDY